MIQKKETPDHTYGAVINALPDNLRKIILSISPVIAIGLEEIRIRQGRPLMIYSNGMGYFLSSDGKVISKPTNPYIVTQEDTRKVLELISNHSVYAFEEEIRNGFITLQGGCRVGLAGKTVIDNGKVSRFQHIISYNIRISREVIGAADKALPFITQGDQVLNTLVLSPPQMGKTTLIRDLARKLSNGCPGFSGLKVGIVDERSEIAGCFQGVPQNDVGIRTDVLDGCPKAEGIIMLIRSMSPRVIITDEIGKVDDVLAVEDALNAGIAIITTAHSHSLEDVRRRPILKALMEKNIFQRILILGNTLGTGTLEGVFPGLTNKNMLDRPIR